ncbi:hypothetical protein [Streptomyces heilongjiangensis]|uniref:Uncharacterized protein n=1 Tax=Streptomyces heilongjiangensis TaxID=945052 RepID=A0ABW1B9U4_9ACTN|nr:hypothetical protein [Streptomyces heilongjiangensis]MDC2950323.1 hypothetical protein [Streptomyces heilongjiangensis]
MCRRCTPEPNSCDLPATYGETGRAREVLDPLRADWEDLVGDSRVPDSLREAMTQPLRTFPPPRDD